MMQMGPYVLPALSEQIHGTCLGSWVGIKVTGRQKQTLYHTFVLKVGFVPEVTAILWGFFGGRGPNHHFREQECSFMSRVHGDCKTVSIVLKCYMLKFHNEPD